MHKKAWPAKHCCSRHCYSERKTSNPRHQENKVYLTTPSHSSNHTRHLLTVVRGSLLTR